MTDDQLVEQMAVLKVEQWVGEMVDKMVVWMVAEMVYMLAER